MLALIILASLSEGWREAHYDPAFNFFMVMFVPLIGPFWIIFIGGGDTFLGVVWLVGDIIIVRSSIIVMKNYLDAKPWWKRYRDYLWGCVFLALPVFVWIITNGVLMAIWSYTRR